MTHPNEALFKGETPFPIIPTCEHYAGNEKRIEKAFELQKELGPVFDITCDCEDGAPTGQEKQHAQMIVRMLCSASNPFAMAGARVHDASHPCWQQDVDIILGGAGDRVAYLTFPKSTHVGDAQRMIEYTQLRCQQLGIDRILPIHVLIETHGALRDVWKIASLPWVQVLDLGLLDFIAAHHGAIGAQAMRSPGQFTNQLVVRARTELAAAALANGLVPSHSITMDMKNTEQTYQDALRARTDFGYLRMYSIYPAQILPIVNAMKPDFDEVRTGIAILLAAQRANWGPIQYEHELYDRASYRYYWELVQRARLTGIELSEEAQGAFFS